MRIVRSLVYLAGAVTTTIALTAVQVHTPLAMMMGGGLGMGGMNPSEVARRHTSMRPPSQSAQDVHPIIRFISRNPCRRLR